MELVAFDLALAALLFLAINRIGRHSVDFGYASPTLFEDANEGLWGTGRRACAPPARAAPASVAIPAPGNRRAG
jgi:hypothetical protein